MKMGIRLSDGIVTLICLAGAFFSLRLFWTDFNQSLSQINAVPLGAVTWKHKAAQRRFVNRVLWEQMQMEAPVYAGDSIRTAERAEATITFTRGVAIEMMENSLIEISAEDELPSLDLVRGDLTVNAAAAQGGSLVQVNAGGRHIQVDGESVMNVHTATDGSFTMRVSEGSVSMDIDGESRRFDSGGSLTLDAEGRTRTEPLTVMLSPRPDARFLLSGTGDAMPLEFVWNGTNYESEDRTRIEIAIDRSFERIVTKVEEGEENSARIPLGAGVYFWRAYPVSGEPATAANAALGKVTIVSVPPLRQLGPAEDQVFRYRTQPPPVRFQWSGSPEIAFYRLEVADNPGFANPALETTVRGRTAGIVSLTYSSLEDGRWYWRVTPVLADEFDGPVNQWFVTPTAPASFTITQSGSLPAPTLQSPSAEALINLAQGTDINFSWQNEAEAVSYTLVISKRSDLQDPLLTRQVRANYYRCNTASTLPGEGRYHWGVYQAAADGTLSPVSASRAFITMEGELTPLSPPDKYTQEEGREQEFTWKTDLSYPLRFQLADTPSFSWPVIDEPVRGGTFRAPVLRTGTWYWRILAQAAGRNVETPVRTIQVVPTLQLPVLTGPLSDIPGQTRRVLVRPGEATAFTWQQVEGAHYYTFKLYSGDNPGDVPLYSASPIRANRTAVPLEQYAEGGYTWTVEALANETTRSARRAGPAGSARFELRLLPIPLLDEARGRRPVERYLIGPAQLRTSRTIPFTWDTVPGATHYLFTLYRETEGEPVLIRRYEPSAEPSFTLDDLSLLGNGNFIWQVEALHLAEDGYIEQRGILGESRFTLNIPVPGRNRAQDPGELYGQ
ncbi:hypothetical protein AGMMS49942_03760 [Spirochaetia bacterium]|nr:hypothetical protein AGMMS49942_03760 [Spirochaetia bacterium]